jgi:ABC-type Fe3+/spermidine/putrescine transport system ATPase subunit
MTEPVDTVTAPEDIARPAPPPAAPAPGVEVAGLSKSYGDTRVLDDVALTVPAGEFHALLGPSGSGKTTILRIIAGFIAADAGTVRVAGRDMTGVPAERRDIGVVFQNYALFPHMNVFQNVAFGLRMRSVGKAELRDRVRDTLALVRMSGFESRKPAELSGGQQQRIAVARALVIRPQVLLLDEPLSALDRKIRGEVREELRRIQGETGVTAIIVTHDQEEALSLSHQMLVLDAGRVRQSGTPDEVYRRPADAFVADFVGSFNAVPVEIERRGGAVVARIGTQSLEVPAAAAGDGPARLLVRPEELSVRVADAPGAPDGTLRGRISDVDFAGPVVTITVDVEHVPVRVLALSPRVLADPAIMPGAEVWISVPLRDVQLAPAAEGG